ncbi:MAG: DUF1688 family protein [Proteobacteria bacterium]|nr:DUF1688 family protein [Pseudomonadota bacterium]
MKHALATLGAGLLRPVDLSAEVSASGNGIRNAAGIFLPEDGSFTKGAAEDLDKLRSWETGMRWRTSLSSDPHCRLRVDSAGLRALTLTGLAEAFQVSSSNPLLGLEGRLSLLHRLADALELAPRYFATGGSYRPGALANTLPFSANKTINASEVLKAVLLGLGPIWPGRLSLHGVSLGDTWKHPKIAAPDETNGLIPFHKLSQWLTYSLLEPLEELGVTIAAMDELTGLAEYRNGGLFIDMGVINPRDPTTLLTAHAPGSEVIIEWRALTVALLDIVADRVRLSLGFTPGQFPLARVLQGGTWSAGRLVALERRPGAGSPLIITSDGTVF